MNMVSNVLMFFYVILEGREFHIRGPLMRIVCCLILVGQRGVLLSLVFH